MDFKPCLIPVLQLGINTSCSEFGLTVSSYRFVSEILKLREVGVEFSISVCYEVKLMTCVSLKCFFQLWACRTTISNPYLELYL